MEQIDAIFEKFEVEIKNVDRNLGQYVEKKLLEFILAGFDKANIPRGNLYNSIKVKYDPDNGFVQLGMLIYGYFVNYGVLNVSGSGAAGDVDTSLWGIEASNGSKFKFKRQGLKPRGGVGITPKTFLPTKEQINDIINLFITEYKGLKQ